MTWNYAYTPIIWLSFLTVLLLIALAIHSGRRRSVPGAFPLMIACLFAALWAAGSVMEYAAVDLATKITWVKFQAVWQIPTITAITCFILEYTWPGRWLTRRNLALLSFPCLLTFGLILTDDLHHLAWRSFVYNSSVYPQFGPAGWLLAAYAFGVLGSLNLIVFGWLFLRSPQNRWPVALMVVGQIGGRLLYLLERGNTLRSVLPLDMLGMAFEFLIYAIALFRFHILDPIPLARQTVIEQLHAGMLVLDLQGRIVSLNPAASAILRSPAKRLLGRPVQEALPSIHELAGDFQAVEISLGTKPETHYYRLEESSLKDWHGLEVGRLLLLRDVTVQKQAQAQIIEQQRALARLQEREHLARELHDSLGQVLGYAGFQLEVVQDRILNGQAALSAGQFADTRTQLAEAGKQLARLSSIVEEAHADLREFILNLRSAPSDQRPFFTALGQYLDGFSQNYGIQTELLVGPGVDEAALDPAAQMQLFRIIQEALSNARKHSGASRVQVSFDTQDQQMRIRVQDNGCGFDLALAGKGTSQTPGHFGLGFMRERAEQIGGVLRVDSAPGKGTCVEMELPAKGEWQMESL